MATRSCLACHLEDADLPPLYADRVADAHPVAWAHKDCLVTPSAEEKDAQEIAD